MYPIQSADFHTARKTVRESGRTALHSYIDIKDIQPDFDLDSNYQHSQEGVASNLDDSQSPAYIWSPGWNSSESLNQFQHSESGAIQGAHPGLLLFAQGQTARTSVVENQPVDSIKGPPVNRQNLLRALPYQHIFADEELSSYVASIKQLRPEDSIRINASQAQSLGLVANQLLEYSFVAASGSLIENNQTQCLAALPLLIDHSIATGVVLLPALLLQRAAVGGDCWLQLAAVDKTAGESADA